MNPRKSSMRKAKNVLAMILAVCAAAVGIGALFWILFVVLHRGIGALDWDFFTKMPTPPGESGGGLANALVGTLLVTLFASLIAVPVGLLAGIYLAEFAPSGKFLGAVRFSVNMLMSVPSIIVGLFVWGSIVVATGHFSGWAGAVSLAVIMLPVVTRTTEDLLNLVPNQLRESVLAMGTPHWRSMGVIFTAARNGLVTGVLLAVARVSGETAPLLFTALNSPYWPQGMSRPTANLPVTIYNYAMSPYPDWKAKAWAASLVITALVLVLSLSARFFFKDKEARR